MSSRGKDISSKTARIVWGKSAGRCQFRNCNASLIGDFISGNLKGNKAYLAHIIASSPTGPRGHETLSHELSDDPDNIMLMCDAHHREIDKENPSLYSVEVLKEMKEEYEKRVSSVLSAGHDSRSHVLRYSSSIGHNETFIPLDECIQAMLPKKTIASTEAIDIKITSNPTSDNDDNFWPFELQNLRQSVAQQQIGHRIEKGDIRHLSVFGLAPMPLLMELGRLLSDISEVSVFQKHREPSDQGWVWAEDKDKVNIRLTSGKPDFKKVALKLSMSDSINDSRIQKQLGSDVSIWEITCDHPNQDVMRRKDDLSDFRRIVRNAFNSIMSQYGKDVELSVFPAMPVSCAIEFGRVWQPKAHPAFQVYDSRGRADFQPVLKFEN